MNVLASFRLENFDPPWFWLLVIAGSLAVLALTYAGIYQRSGRRLTWMLATMRTVGVLALIVALVKPAWRETVEQHERPITAVIVDDSQSMSLPHGEQSRYELARQWLNDAPAGEALRRDFDVHWFDMAGRPLQEGLPNEPIAEQTDLVRAMRSVERQLRGRHVAGVVAISDGRDTTAREGYAALQDYALPVYAVGFAPQSRAGDAAQVEVVSVEAPTRARVHNTVAVQVLLRKAGGPAADVPVRIERTGNVLTSETVSLPDGRSERLVSIDYTPEQPGEFVLAARAGTQAQRALGGRDAKLFRLRVEAEPVRVLYIEGVLRPEARFLRERLSQDPDVDLISFSRAASADEAALSGMMIGSELISDDRLQQIDVVLLGDFEAAMLDDATYARLRTWVEEGGGLMVLGGYHNLGDRGLRHTDLATTLPVEVGSRSIEQIDEPFRFTLTDAGQRHPAMRVTGDLQRDAALWSSLPQLPGIVATSRARPGATVLARHPRTNPDDADGDGFVVLATQPFGQGVTAVMTADTTWRWSRIARLAGESDTMYVRFWSQMVRYLAQRDEASEQSAISVTTAAASYQRGQRVSITARRNPAAMLPSDEGQATAMQLSVQQPDGRRVQLTAEPSATDPNRWTASFFPDRGGRFRIDAELMQSDAAGSQAIATETSEFLVAGSNLELDDPTPNPAAMQQVARLTGGIYAGVDDTAASQRLAEALPRDERTTYQARTRQMWNSPALFFVFLGFVTAEWAVRRRSRLV
ncbi:MAG: glutamine amidotransferase [Phycisphaeraceae bacterium]